MKLHPDSRPVRPSSVAALAALAAAAALLRAPASARQEAAEARSQEELEQTAAAIRADIEAIRAREFVRPVEVRTTDAAGFVRYAKQRLEEMTTPEAMRAEEELAKLLFLVPPEVDLVAMTMEVLEEQVGGFYDPASDTMFLMESFTGNLARVILAHELTHALDDQLFGIDEGLEAREGDADAQQAYGSVVEGSGTIVMTVWMMEHGGELSAADLAEAGSMGTEALASAPPYVWKPLLSSYLSGQAFLERGYRARKKQGLSRSDVIEEAFRAPPASTEQVLHPDKYWGDEERDEPRRLRHGDEGLAPGWELAERRVFGELGLAMVAASEKERAPVDLDNAFAVAFMKYTNRAAEGWGGDEAVLLRNGEARAARLETVWDTAEDARQFAAAIEAIGEPWRAALAELDAAGVGHGLRVVRADEVADRVTLVAWHGVAAPELDALLATLACQELPSDG